ncbi:hypothetical protein X943_000537 [Babesia divergens]|uniref:J domain-containing protein n=1 Tax=Babesia divergens TaxID=32595 RepID=A0AAD9GHJ2_BABDI|nr:hypothetical protein X943_000537 [Babesia divergens]
MAPPDLNDILTAVEVLQLGALDRIQLADVRRSFCQAVKRGHPDKAGGSVSSFNQVMQAYNTLRQYFKRRDDERKADETSPRAFRQPLVRRDMVFSEDDSAYYSQCRCGDIIEVPTAAIALDITQYTCATCSLMYSLEG